MNWKQIEDHWDRASGQVRTAWGKLTVDDVADTARQRQYLLAKLEKRYGVLKGDVAKHVNGWLGKVEADADARPTPEPGENARPDERH